MKISVVVPVYNEESTIGPVLDELQQVALDKEIIVVDDASGDNTMAIVQGHPLGVTVEMLPVNGGKGTAVRRGIELATGDIVVIQDADLELSPARILALVEPILSGEADAVFGSRFLDRAERVAWTRRIANTVLTRLVNLTFGTRLTDMETAHKAFKRGLVAASDLRARRFEIEVELTAHLARAGAHIKEIPSPYSPRTRAEGKKIRWVDGLIAIWTIIKLGSRRWEPRG